MIIFFNKKAIILEMDVKGNVTTLENLYTIFHLGDQIYLQSTLADYVFILLKI